MRKVFLHIGAPKTGTTYLQNRLAVNAKSLAEHGVHFPGGSLTTSPELAQFRAALDLRGQDWGGAPGHADGAWASLMRKVRRLDGTVIISHEILAAASRAEVERATRDLAGSELHVVYTARDLGRLVPAAWQESVKQGRRWKYQRCVRRIQRGRSFWAKAFDLPRSLNTWGHGLAPERVHLITVPQQRGGGDSLWLRACGVLGIDPDWAPEESLRRNPSLGLVETEVLRKLNRRMDRATRRELAVNTLVADILAEGQLARTRSALPELPPTAHGWAEEQTQRWIDWIRGSGIDVVGDLDDLWPTTDRGPDYLDPTRVSAKQQLAVALDALEFMTAEAANRPDPRQQFSAKVRRRFGR